VLARHLEVRFFAAARLTKKKKSVFFQKWVGRLEDGIQDKPGAWRERGRVRGSVLGAGTLLR
jgi:hypothetical protein